jgi:two-component system, cell cycle response regulator DivK
MPLCLVDENAPIFPRFFSNPEDDDHDAAHKAARRLGQSVGPDALTILVVDDDLANLALAEAVLQAEGFQVRVAIDAASTFEVLKTCMPSLILMDIQLPEVDGWELTRRLKADAATSRIPVIAITAYGEDGDDRKARQAGFVEYLPKPVSTRDLPRIVRRHLVGR